jgi:hypothetical protein
MSGMCALRNVFGPGTLVVVDSTGIAGGRGLQVVTEKLV